jgi:hypothetical protein
MGARYGPGMSRASSSERAYFARVARQSAALDDEAPPASLAEMFDRLERVRRALGDLARPGAAEAGDADLEGHRAFLAKLRARRVGTRRA